MKKNYSFEEIYRLYMNDLYYYLLSLIHQKESAEDLVQESEINYSIIDINMLKSTE